MGPRGIWVGDIADPKSKVVIADIVRAGSVPAETVYGQLTTVIDPENVRKDVIVMARQVGPDGRVTGTEHGYSKIDGSIQDSILLIPEPMVATGGTIDKLFQVYAEMDAGEPAMAILMAMIVTPEALRLLTSKYPKLRIHAARLDRGMSDQDVLNFMPGMYPDRERGLTDTDYIGPGAGGVGERTNNTRSKEAPGAARAGGEFFDELHGSSMDGARPDASMSGFMEVVSGRRSTQSLFVNSKSNVSSTQAICPRAISRPAIRGSR